MQHREKEREKEKICIYCYRSRTTHLLQNLGPHLLLSPLPSSFADCET